MGRIIERALLGLVLYFGLPLVIYALALFVTWGASWNPGYWTQDIRMGAVVAWCCYAAFATAILIDLT